MQWVLEKHSIETTHELKFQEIPDFAALKFGTDLTNSMLSRILYIIKNEIDIIQ